MSRYQDIAILNTPEGKRYYGTNFYPTIPLSDSDIYVITDERDRYDMLANQYYGDVSLWWIIASANVSFKASLVADIIAEGIPFSGFCTLIVSLKSKFLNNKVNFWNSSNSVSLQIIVISVIPTCNNTAKG